MECVQHIHTWSVVSIIECIYILYARIYQADQIITDFLRGLSLTVHQHKKSFRTNEHEYDEKNMKCRYPALRSDRT
jgi:hypothetical protein